MDWEELVGLASPVVNMVEDAEGRKRLERRALDEYQDFVNNGFTGSFVDFLLFSACTLAEVTDQLSDQGKENLPDDSPSSQYYETLLNSALRRIDEIEAKLAKKSGTRAKKAESESVCPNEFWGSIA